MAVMLFCCSGEECLMTAEANFDEVNGSTPKKLLSSFSFCSAVLLAPEADGRSSSQCQSQHYGIMGVVKPLLKLSNQMMNYFTTSFNASVNRLVNKCLASLPLESRITCC
jgi:hypothetical protein